MHARNSESQISTRERSDSAASERAKQRRVGAISRFFAVPPRFGIKFRKFRTARRCPPSLLRAPPNAQPSLHCRASSSQPLKSLRGKVQTHTHTHTHSTAPRAITTFSRPALFLRRSYCATPTAVFIFPERFMGHVIKTWSRLPCLAVHSRHHL